MLSVRDDFLTKTNLDKGEWQEQNMIMQCDPYGVTSF